MLSRQIIQNFVNTIWTCLPCSSEALKNGNFLTNKANLSIGTMYCITAIIREVVPRVAWYRQFKHCM